jgi:hypothetical protein
MTRHHLLKYSWITLIALGVACNGSATISKSSSTSTGGSAAVSAGATTPAVTDNFPKTPDPVTVKATLDTEHAVSNKMLAQPGIAYMGQVGGQTADGTDFMLQFPGGLLSLDADGNQVPAYGSVVTVTPISAIEGIPFSKGYLAAVHIAPEGTLLIGSASLSMTIDGEYKDSDLVGFAADGVGEDFHLFPIQTYASNGKTQVYIDIMHFSLYGVAQATLEEIQAQHDHPPVKPASQDEDDLAPLPVVEQDDLAALTPKVQFKLSKSYDQTIKKDMAKLDTVNCKQVGNIAYNFTAWQTRVANSGVEAHFHDQIIKDASALADKLEKCLKQACGVCTGTSAKKSDVDSFLVLAAWAESINMLLDRPATATAWRSLANQCAEHAGLPPPQPQVADCGSDCEPVPTEIQCPK